MFYFNLSFSSPLFHTRLIFLPTLIHTISRFFTRLVAEHCPWELTPESLELNPRLRCQAAITEGINSLHQAMILHEVLHEHSQVRIEVNDL